MSDPIIQKIIANLNSVNQNDSESLAVEKAIDLHLFEVSGINKSIISDPIFIYKIPEIKNLDIDFKYNFFTKNERQVLNNDNEAQILIESNHNDNFDADFLLSKARNKHSPRQVHLTFAKPDEGEDFEQLTSEEITLVRNADPSKIITEASQGNLKNIFFGLELSDRGTEQNVIEKLRQSSLLLHNAGLNDQSYVDLAQQVSELLDEPTGVTGLGKKILLEKISAMRSQGFATSVDENRESLSTDPISNENFSIKINKLFAKDILKFSITKNTGIFEEEHNELQKYTSNLRENALSGILLSGGPNSISERDNAVIAEPIAIIGNLNANSNVPATKMKLAGYLIDKIEQMPDETLISRPSIFITNPLQTAYVDSNVRYGGKYIYKVRSVCMFEAQTVLIDPEDASGSSDQAILAKFLVASSGRETKVFCVEDIPPKPPQGIRCRFDFKHKKPVISWQFPINKQRDIKRFQIFKRNSSNLPFTLIAEYNFDNSDTPTSVKEIAQEKNLINLNPKIPKLYHMDPTFSLNDKPIYAIASVDAHGLTSNLSTQIQVRYEKFENRLHKKLFSREGAPKQFPNMFMERDTFADCIKISGRKRMITFFNPEYYQVFKNKFDSNGNLVEEVDQQLIAADPTKNTYKLQIINLDLQKDQVVNVKVSDLSAVYSVQPASNFDAFRNNIL